MNNNSNKTSVKAAPGTPNLPTKIVPAKISTRTFREIPCGPENSTPQI